MARYQDKAREELLTVCGSWLEDGRQDTVSCRSEQEQEEEEEEEGRSAGILHSSHQPGRFAEQSECRV